MMRRLQVLVIGLSVLTLFVFSRAATADMEECGSGIIQKSKEALAKSKKFEASGDYEAAYNSVPNYECSVNDRALANEMDAARKRLGPKAAAQIEDKKPDVACKLYQEYSNKSNNHQYTKDADRVILKHAKSVPVDNPHGFLACTPSDDAKLRAELKEIAARNADKVFEKEAAKFNEVSSRDELMASRELLETANYWGRLYPIENKSIPAKSREIAIKHGDKLKAHDDAKSLELAIAYYDLYDSNEHSNEDRKKSVRNKAYSLGNDMLKKKDYPRAAEYFAVAGDRGKRDEALKLAKGIKDENQRSAKEKEITRQKAFKSDADKLDKELGM
jgi:hypothetical protein